MKWMYGYDGAKDCWQPTRTVDGGRRFALMHYFALIIAQIMNVGVGEGFFSTFYIIAWNFIYFDALAC